MYKKPYKPTVGIPRPQSNPWNITGKIERPNNSQMLKLINTYQNEEDEGSQEEILDDICKYHLDLIVCYAGEFTEDKEELNNLIQEGFAGLIRAAQTFDRSKGASWITHASWRIKGGMHHYMRDKSAVVRKPAKIYAVENKIRHILQADDDRSLPDILGTLDIDDRSVVEEYLRYKGDFSTLLPLDMDDEIGDAVDVANDAKAVNPNIDYEDVSDIDNRILIEQVAQILTELEFAILQSYYLKSMTKTDIFKQFKLKNVNEVNKILNRALKKAHRFVGARAQI